MYMYIIVHACIFVSNYITCDQINWLPCQFDDFALCIKLYNSFLLKNKQKIVVCIQSVPSLFSAHQTWGQLDLNVINYYYYYTIACPITITIILHIKITLLYYILLLQCHQLLLLLFCDFSIDI